MDEQTPTQAETGKTESAPFSPVGTPPAQPVYPYYYYPQPPLKTSIDTATLALVLAAIGLVYWFPPFVLPGVAFYLAGEAKKEIEAGIPVAPNAMTFIKVARGLAIAGIVIAGLFFVFIILLIILGSIYG